MQAFEAVITRDGSVHHVPWGSHLDVIERCGIPENNSMLRQNYWEYDLQAPFVGGYNGLQARGVETPPEGVVRAAERLAERLRQWHSGRALKTIPEEWGDMVEHVYQVMGSRTPKYLNGRGGVYFRDCVEEVREGRVARLLGTARVGRLSGTASVGGMWGRARVDEMTDTSRIDMLYEAASVGRMLGNSEVQMMCQSSVVEEMRDSARVLIMHGASRVLALHDTALAARGCDGVVSTPFRKVRKRPLLNAHERWKKVVVVKDGASVFA